MCFRKLFPYVSRSYFFAKTFYIEGAFSYFKQVLTVLFWSEWSLNIGTCAGSSWLNIVYWEEIFAQIFQILSGRY